MPRVMGPPITMPPQLRSPTPAGAPIILAPRMQLAATSMAQQAMLTGQMIPSLVSPTDPSGSLATPGGLVYNVTDPYALQPGLFDATSYAAMDQSAVGMYVR